MSTTTIPTAPYEGINWGYDEMFDIDKWDIPQFFDVIILEDDMTTTRLIKAIARGSNNSARIKSFSTAEDAITHIETLKRRNWVAPDLAIVDIYLRGEQDGLEFCERLNALYPETNVVVTSSVQPQLYMEKAKHLQSKPLFLPKPFTIKQISNLFNRLN